jgi:hypothetical protein
MGLNVAGLLLIIAAVTGFGPAGLLGCLSLVGLGTGEMVGRLRFYKAYRRLGL